MRINKKSHLVKLFEKLNNPKYWSWNDTKSLTIPANSIKFKELNNNIYQQLGVIDESRIPNELASKLLNDRELSNISEIYKLGEFTPINTVDLFSTFSDGIFGDGLLYADDIYIDTYWCYYNIVDRSGNSADYFIISTPKSFIRITSNGLKFRSNSFLKKIYEKVFLSVSTNELSMLPVNNEGKPLSSRPSNIIVDINTNHIKVTNNLEAFLVDNKPVVQLDLFNSFMIDPQEINKILINFIKGDVGVTKYYFSENPKVNFSERLKKVFSTSGYCATVRFPGNDDYTDFKNYKVIRVYTEADNERDVKYQLGKILDKKYGYSWSIENIESPISESSCDMHIFDLQRLIQKQ